MPAVVYSDANAIVSSERNLIVAEWRSPPNTKQFDAYWRALREIARIHGADDVASIHIMHRGVPDFSDGIRSVVTRAFGDPSIRAKALAFVVLPQGLVGAAIRGFLGTAQLLGRPASPVKVFSDLPAAAEWVASRLRGAPDALTASEILAIPTWDAQS